ncbi:MAG: hypothetical protein ACR2MO_01990 [Acidimicrobiales bacterium]
MNQGADEPSRGPGRPRKWDDDAERARAYRLRRAAELADPERLRAECRTLRRQVGHLTRKLARLEDGLGWVEHERDVALRDLEDRSATLATARAELDRLRRFQAPPPLADAIPPTVDEPAPVAGNRASRRLAERAHRRH